MMVDEESVDLLVLGSVFTERVIKGRWQRTIVETYLNGFYSLEYPGNEVAFSEIKIKNSDAFNYACHRAFLSDWTAFKTLDPIHISLLKTVFYSNDLVRDIYFSSGGLNDEYFGVDEFVFDEIRKLVLAGTAKQKFDTALKALPGYFIPESIPINTAWWSYFKDGFNIFSNIITGKSLNNSDNNAIYTASTNSTEDQIVVGDIVMNRIPLIFHLTPTLIADGAVRRCNVVMSNEIEMILNFRDDLNSWARNVFFVTEVKEKERANQFVKNISPISAIGLGEVAITTGYRMKVMDVFDFSILDKNVCKVVFLEETEDTGISKDMITGVIVN